MCENIRVHPLGLGLHRHASEMSLKWRFAGGPIVVFGSSSHQLKKNVVNAEPPLTKFPGSVHEILVNLRQYYMQCSIKSLNFNTSYTYTVKPALVVTCIKQATCIEQASIRFPQRAKTLKSTCIKQASVLSKHILTIP